MPFGANSATFANVSGASNAVAGDIVQSAVWDNIHIDYSAAFTQVMSQLISMTTCRNALYMNGGFEVWQRGAGSSASIAVAGSTIAYTADRWYLNAQGAQQASVVSAQAGLTNGSNLAGRVLINNGQLGTSQMIFGYPLDTDEIARLRGSKVSFTATVKAGANWSPTSGTLVVTVYCGTGAVGKRNVTPYTNETTALTISTNLTPGGAVTTITGNSSAVIPTTTTQMEMQFSWNPSGTTGVANSFDVDDVQLEPQTSATTWTPTAYDRLPFWEMYTACQRHYYKSFNYGVAPAQAAGGAGAWMWGSQVANIAFAMQITFPVVMRVTASVTSFNPTNANANWNNLTSTADITASIDPNTRVSQTQVVITGVSVSAAAQNVGIHVTASAGI